MDPMEPSSIELKLISCKDLKAFNFFQKLTLYALVSIASDDPRRELKENQKQQQRTQTHRDDEEDGSNPEWNHETRFDLEWVSVQDSGNLFFHFEFRHDGLILGDKLIGECRVPLRDLIQDAGYCVGDVARFVSYEVRSGDGKPNGIFNFRYRLNGNHSSQNQILEGRITGYPVVDPEVQDQHHHAPNHSHLQYPTSEFNNPCCYPPVGSVYSPSAAAPQPPPPPPVSYPPSAEYHSYYPPPQPPPPYPYPYPYPPPSPPPVEHGPQYYPPFGPEAHPWPSGPNFEHRW